MLKQSYYNNICCENGNTLLLYNSYSQGVCRISRDIYDIINKNLFEESNLEQNVCRELKRQGFIVDYDVCEVNRVLAEEAARIWDNHRDVLSFVIAPTLRCNYRCYYCFESGKHFQISMDDETESAVLKYIKESVRRNHAKTLQINWFGGEPLLELNRIVDFSKDIISWCTENGIRYRARIITNGYYFTVENAKKLFYECSINNAQITIDGTENIYIQHKKSPEDSYRVVLKNIVDASRFMKISIRLNIVESDYDIMPSLLDQLYETFFPNDNISIYLADVCEDYGRDSIEVRNPTNYWTQREKMDDYIESKGYTELLNCSLPKRKLSVCGLIGNENAVIGPRGELYRCEHYVGTESEIVGTCSNGYYYNDAYWKYSKINHPNKCLECKMFPVCMSKCPNDIESGRLDRMDCNAYLDYVKKLVVRRYGM